MASSGIPHTDQTCNARCNLTPSKLDKASTEGAGSIQYEDEYEKCSAALHPTWNAVMAQGNYKSPSFYNKVCCLLISWDENCDDLKTEKEVAGLANDFENRFHFKVKRELLTNNPQHPAHSQVMMHIAKFIWDEDEAHTLLLFYYAGHGTPKAFRDGSNSLALTGKSSNSGDAVFWGFLEENFHQTKADVLEIFDCCYAGDLGRTRQAWGTRSFEFLGACSSGNTTCSPGDESFTTALRWALRALVENQTRFTLSELMRKIREAPNFPADQVPVHLDRGAQTVERIIIAPLLETGNHESTVIEKSIDDAPRVGLHAARKGLHAPPKGLLHLNFIFEKPPSQATIEKFAHAMNRLVKEQELPVDQIAWGGLVSWRGTQPSCAVQETMMTAVKMFKEGHHRKKSRDAGDGIGAQSESAQHSLPPHGHRFLEKRVMLTISACIMSVLIGTHRSIYSVFSNLWSRFS